jgi:hypothetical protein
MADILEWLDENSLRSFPFLLISDKVANTSYVLDNGLILDLALINNTTPSQNLYALVSIDASASPTVIFNFTNSISFTTSSNLSGIQYLIGTNNSKMTINASLLGAIPTSVNIFTNLQVEPSLIFEYYNDWLGVTQLTISPDYESGGIDYEYEAITPLQSQSSPNLTGNIVFYEGFNIDINFDTINNLILLTVGNSYGIPLSCSNQFINPEDTDCDEIISYINGVPPASDGTFNIAPGTNINLVLGTSIVDFYDSYNLSEPANSHSLFIGFTFLEEDLCQTIAVLP